MKTWIVDPPAIDSDRTGFQLAWLKQIHSTIEELIVNPRHRQRRFLVDATSHYINLIRFKVCPGNEKTFRDVDQRFEALMVLEGSPTASVPNLN